MNNIIAQDPQVANAYEDSAINWDKLSFAGSLLSIKTQEDVKSIRSFVGARQGREVDIKSIIRSHVSSKG